MKMPIPRLYLGTMTFGWSQTSSRVDESVALDMMKQFIRHNVENPCSSREDASGNDKDKDDAGGSVALVHRIDTARIYAGGKTEPMVGNVIAKSTSLLDAPPSTELLVGAPSQPTVFAISTKAHPSQPGGLSPQGIETQLQTSLQALGVSKVDEYYLHQPDPEHSLRDSLRYLHSLVEQGIVRTVGMSNYHVSEMERAFEICREEQWTPPQVYQGLYNPLNRLVEHELLPLLQKHNCAFVAYNPLAAGLLAGKYDTTATSSSSSTAASSSLLENVPKGRFKNNQNYLPRFYTPENFQAVELIRQACAQENISMIEATYRWLLCHSALNGKQGDGVLIGASSLTQLKENLNACASANNANTTPLPSSILQAFDEAWAITEKAGCFPYWRSYSSDMPNRDELDPGASYNANKTKK